MSVDASVLLQGVGLGVLRVPLHQIHLQSDLISDLIVVGVRPSLPVKSVSLILSNDLVGGKVQSHLQVVSDTEQVLCSPSAVDGPSDTIPACVVTRAAVTCTPAQKNDSPTSQSVLLNDQE